jgi:capsular polysaccharide biosynthesis protein
MTDGDHGGRRRRRTPVVSPPRLGARDEGPERPWFDDDGVADRSADVGMGVADRSADVGTDLVNLGFIRASLRRSKRLWAGLAVLGLLLGIAMSATRPHTSEASTTLLLTVGPEGQPGIAILNDQAVAQSRGVAGIAVRKLGSQESVDSLLTTYKTTVVTDRVLRITASAPSSSQAIRRANAIASAFLAFRADQLQTQQKLQFAALDDTLAQSEQRVESIDARISEVATQPTSDSQQTQLKNLRATRDQAQSELDVLNDQVKTAKATAEETTAAMVGQSKVLDAASPLPHSGLKPLILFSAGGLIVGLVLGLGIVIIRALVSDRLRRRDDVALALGAPVRLSVTAKPPSRWRPGRQGLAAAQGRDIQRIAEFLRGILPSGSRRRALAVVAVDDTRVAAMSVVSLAISLAQQNAKVMVADLCTDAPAGHLVGLRDPGVRAVQVDGTQIHLAIPDSHEIAPVGPFSARTPHTLPTLAGQVVAACASADVLLTLTTLDPSLASDHLHTWAADAVVVVTAGRSSWTKIHAVGEMIRLAGTRLVAAVLVGADKWDESLGVTPTPDAGRDASVVTGNGSTDQRPSDAPTLQMFMTQ